MRMKAVIAMLIGINIMFSDLYDMGESVDKTGFSLQEMTMEEQMEYENSLEITKYLEEPEEEIKEPIDCFDVSEDGIILIGCYRKLNKRIMLYDSDGSFLWQYQIHLRGEFEIEWVNDGIALYSGEYQVAIVFDLSGKIISVKKINNTLQSRNYWYQLYDRTCIAVGNREYVIRSEMGILNWIGTSQTQLVLIEENGEEKILYDVNDRTIVIMVITLSVATCACIVHKIYEKKKFSRTYGY